MGQERALIRQTAPRGETRVAQSTLCPPTVVSVYAGRARIGFIIVSGRELGTFQATYFYEVISPSLASVVDADYYRSLK